MTGPEPVARRRPRSPAGRVVHAWRGLPPERRLAAAAALGLFVTLFLPWYQETVITTGVKTKFALPSASLTGWAAFSFVEAAVLLVAIAVLLLLFVRAEGRAFHVPGGDGGVIFAAGLWTAVLILWRTFDKSSTTGHGQYVTTSGIEWGIFIALGIAALLAYAGSRIKLAHEPEPPLPGERATPRSGAARAGRARDAPRRDATRHDAPPRDADAGWVTPDPSAGDQAARPRRPRPEREPGQRGLNFSDLDEIKFDEPPEAPTVRHAPAAPTVDQTPEPRRHPDPDDQLAMRLDRPD